MNISQNSDIINSLIHKNRASSFPALQHLSEFRHNYVVDSEKQEQNLLSLVNSLITLPYDSIHVSYQNWNHGCSFIFRQQMSLLANKILHEHNECIDLVALLRKVHITRCTCELCTMSINMHSCWTEHFCRLTVRVIIYEINYLIKNLKLILFL